LGVCSSRNRQTFNLGRSSGAESVGSRRFCGRTPTPGNRKTTDSRDTQRPKILRAAHFGEAIFTAKPREGIKGPAHRRSCYSPRLWPNGGGKLLGPPLFDYQPNPRSRQKANVKTDPRTRCNAFLTDQVPKAKLPNPHAVINSASHGVGASMFRMVGGSCRVHSTKLGP